MMNNELALLDQVLAQRQTMRTKPMRDDDAFELFACEQAMVDSDLSSDEIADGVLGGGNDGGIDGAYVSLSGSLLSEDSEVLMEGFNPSRVPSGAMLELWLIQAKRETSFSESAIEKISDSSRRLLSLTENEEDLLALYSSSIVTRTGFFRKALRNLATRHPVVSIKVVYATRGISSEVNSKVKIKSKDLESLLAGVMPGATAQVEFLGAADLWRRSSAVPSYTTQLTYQENATSGNSHVALVKLRDYMNFLSDGDDLRRHIFDWNVRDYQGNVEVNKEIRESLQDQDAPEFWWLNNGVTVVCSKASVVGKTYSLDDVQVVNGLQTSHTIFNFLKRESPDHSVFDRSVLVRILVTGDDLKTRDRVIRATNRQTSVPAASLRATDDIQRDIEAYFLGNDWYYDRRKNFYKNSGKSQDRIVSIPLLAQSVMAMGLSRPNDSRARPSSLLKRDEDYKRIFSRKIDLAIYLWLAESQKSVDAFLLSEEADATAQERSNLRFHLSMVAASKLAGTRLRSPSQLQEIVREAKTIFDADLRECLLGLRSDFSEFQISTGSSADKIAKGQEFVDFLLED